MTDKRLCDLKSCFLCSCCLHEWLPAVAANKRNLEVKKGRTLFDEGSPVTGIYFIYSGVLKVHKRWDQEKDLILRFAKAGDIIGQLGLGNDPVYPVSATAIETAIVCYVDMEFFNATLTTNTGFTRNFVTLLASQLQESEKRMRNLAHMPVKGRVAQALISLQQQFGKTGDGFIGVEISRQDLASFTGAVYESLFRALNDLIKAQLIIVAGKGISIINESALQQVADDINS